MRLIDADALKAKFEKQDSGALGGHKRYFVCTVIEDEPTIEAEPVKHGRWETWGYVFHGIAWKRCSECGKTADVSYQALLDGKIEMATPSICGCCSARMDGGSE